MATTYPAGIRLRISLLLVSWEINCLAMAISFKNMMYLIATSLNGPFALVQPTIIQPRLTDGVGACLSPLQRRRMEAERRNHDDRIWFCRAFRRILTALNVDECLAWPILDNLEWCTGYGSKFWIHRVSLIVSRKKVTLTGTRYVNYTGQRDDTRQSSSSL
ncbi:2bcf274f-c360-4eef-ae36-7dc2aadcdf62-CDS [Sclerotinia trifoliorum]|uniref:2bcf274f-c360-4eef-ae36-7dc2aadcdf62-CDS n=1 Tax=Sclerotinia trifoliorum TaxID=28548 RepID=A0A8H2ZSB5_9HELO|nr:2bcf274f-c360-4eef-ae36-7dc2aadcdf62-CDS [Sclerotinia trifoliorum]